MSWGIKETICREELCEIGRHFKVIGKTAFLNTHIHMNLPDNTCSHGDQWRIWLFQRYCFVDQQKKISKSVSNKDLYFSLDRALIASDNKFSVE